MLCVHDRKGLGKGQANLVGHCPSLDLQMMRSSGLSAQQGSYAKAWAQV